MSQVLVKLADKLTPNQKKFIAEVIGTFILVVFAIGSVVLDARMNGVLGIPFIALAPFVGVAIGVYVFGRISMAHLDCSQKKKARSNQLASSSLILSTTP